MVFKTRDLLVRQRNQIVNALRRHLMEYGIVVPAGLTFVRRLEREIDDPDTPLPLLVVELGSLLIDQLQSCNTNMTVVERQMKEEKRDPEALRLQTAPGIGPVSARAIRAFGPDMYSFRRGRDLAAWLGLVPLQKSTGGKQKLGRTSKMGQRDIRRLLIIGAMTRIRWAVKNGAPEGSWLPKMLQRKPRLLIAIAVANKTARAIRAMMTKGEEYRGEPVSA